MNTRLCSKFPTNTKLVQIISLFLLCYTLSVFLLFIFSLVTFSKPGTAFQFVPYNLMPLFPELLHRIHGPFSFCSVIPSASNKECYVLYFQQQNWSSSKQAQGTRLIKYNINNVESSIPRSPSYLWVASLSRCCRYDDCWIRQYS